MIVPVHVGKHRGTRALTENGIVRSWRTEAEASRIAAKTPGAKVMEI